MIRPARAIRGQAITAMAVLAGALMAGDAVACATCFGNPDSNMSKGVVWGVIVLVGIVGFVLASVAGVGLFWLQRGRRLTQLDSSSSESA